jgi:hypothetical protein
MGIAPQEVPTFTTAHQLGVRPVSLAEAEIRGAPLDTVRRRFARPALVRWAAIRDRWGARGL